MTIAQTTHRRDSLVRRRSVERAGAGTDRSAHRRPGAGFLPPRLPVARRAGAGYRIYPADDFFHGLDCESLELGTAADGSRAGRNALPGRTEVGRRVAWCAVLCGTVTAVVAVLWSTMALRTTRPGGRAWTRGIPPAAARAGRESPAARVGARNVAGGSGSRMGRAAAAVGRRRRGLVARNDLVRVVAHSTTPKQTVDALSARVRPREQSGGAEEAHLEFGFER